MKPSSLYVHTPAHLLESRLQYLLHRNLQPEVACQEVSFEQLDLSQIKDCSQQLKEQQLNTTVHAPFNGFNPGSGKNRIRKTAHRMCQQSLHLAETLNARCIVFHPGIPHQASQKTLDNWLKNALEFWPDYISQAKQIGTIITIENIYESSTAIFQHLFAELSNDNFGHCFDVGHWNIFAEDSLDYWFEMLGRYIRHLHLHDNQGQSDEHLPLGAGQINFAELLDRAADLPTEPSMTLEAHRLVDLELSLEALATMVKNRESARQ